MRQIVPSVGHGKNNDAREARRLEEGGGIE
jgi:hypothetical protein